MPTWHVSSWQPRQIVQPMATIEAVPKPSRLAPRQISLSASSADAQAAVGPDLDAVADAGLGERVVGEHRAELAGQAGAPQGVLAGGAGAAVEAGQGDDVGSGLGDADRDRADARAPPGP